MKTYEHYIGKDAGLYINLINQKQLIEARYKGSMMHWHYLICKDFLKLRDSCKGDSEIKIHAAYSAIFFDCLVYVSTHGDMVYDLLEHEVSYIGNDFFNADYLKVSEIMLSEKVDIEKVLAIATRYYESVLEDNEIENQFVLTLDGYFGVA